MPISTTIARFQLWRGRKLVPLLKAYALKHGLPAEYVLAVASRETNLQNILGDGGHGVGVIQIDVQHEIARAAKATGTWRTKPEPLIDFGCRMLANRRRQAEAAFPNFTPAQHLKVAASGYNTGFTRAKLGSEKGDSDIYTTGHDYGRDVMSRSEVFRKLL
jgi:hypothetical protein